MASLCGFCPRSRSTSLDHRQISGAMALFGDEGKLVVADQPEALSSFPDTMLPALANTVWSLQLISSGGVVARLTPVFRSLPRLEHLELRSKSVDVLCSWCTELAQLSADGMRLSSLALNCVGDNDAVRAAEVAVALQLVVPQLKRLKFFMYSSELTNALFERVIPSCQLQLESLDCKFTSHAQVARLVDCIDRLTSLYDLTCWFTFRWLPGQIEPFAAVIRSNKNLRHVCVGPGADTEPLFIRALENPHVTRASFTSMTRVESSPGTQQVEEALHARSVDRPIMVEYGEAGSECFTRMLREKVTMLRNINIPWDSIPEARSALCDPGWSLEVLKVGVREEDPDWPRWDTKSEELADVGEFVSALVTCSSLRRLDMSLTRPQVIRVLRDGMFLKEVRQRVSALEYEKDELLEELRSAVFGNEVLEVISVPRIGIDVLTLVGRRNVALCVGNVRLTFLGWVMQFCGAQSFDSIVAMEIIVQAELDWKEDSRRALQEATQNALQMTLLSP